MSLEGGLRAVGLAVTGARRVGAPAILMGLLCPTVAQAATTDTTATYSSSGQHLFSVPLGVTSVTVVALGAAGGSCEGVGGGQGDDVTATVPVSGGEPLLVGVGGAGEQCHNPEGGAGGIGGGGPGGRGNNRDGGAGGGGRGWGLPHSLAVARLPGAAGGRWRRRRCWRS